MRAERRPTYSAVVTLYFLACVGIALLLGSWVLSTHGLPNWVDVGFFWVVASLANIIGRVEVPLGSLRVVDGDTPQGIPLAPGFIVLVTAAYATRPSTAITVAIIPALSELIKAERRTPLRLAFNTAQESIYVGVASIAFWAVRDNASGIVGSFAAAFVGALLAVALNHLLVGIGVALIQRVAFKEVVRRMAWPAPLSLGFGLIALLIASLYVRFGPVSTLFLFMPLTALRVVREAKLSLDAAIKRTLTDFARAVDEKDPYTYRHSDRVAMMTVELHKELGTRARDYDRRWSAALLHDVGKVAIPAEILTKTAALTPAEYEAIKSHPTLGAEAVQEIDLFRELAPEIRYHHERVDGRGYPDGLVGEQIPFEARVLAVADAFDALTSDRPYRRALTPHEALAELSRSAGVQHDRDVVGALHRVVAKGVTFVRPERQVTARTSESRLSAVQTA